MTSIALAVACGLAVAVSAGLLWLGPRQRPGRPVAPSGVALLFATLLGAMTLWALGGATTLTMIVLPAALLLGLVDAILTARRVHWVWRLAVHGVVILGTMAVEWFRGDLFASGAVMATVAGVVGYNVIAFAVGAAQRSDAPRVPVVLGLLGAGYLLVIAVGLPNPGLAGLCLLVIAGLVPLLVWTTPPGVVDHALGPVLAGLAIATGYCAWLANASPAMVVAPVLVVGIDVAWTLGARLLTARGRAALGGAGGWWRRVDAFATPSDDLVVQRAAARGSTIAATSGLIGTTLVVVLLSLGQWWLGVPWLVALIPALVVALGWLVLQLPVLTDDTRRRLIALGTVSAVGLLGTVAAWRLDGRALVMLVPLASVGLVWVADWALRARRGTVSATPGTMSAPRPDTGGPDTGGPDTGGQG